MDNLRKKIYNLFPLRNLYKVPLENTDEKIRAHTYKKCKARGYPIHCSIHKRSKHHMRSFPQHWNDEAKRIDRVCSHGYGHPDPDHIYRRLDEQKWSKKHECDGCCFPYNY